MRDSGIETSILRRNLPLWLIAFANALALLVILGATPTRLYSLSPTHRWQASAMLEGHFYLSDSIFDVGFDNTFPDGKVQQVWGLGVPLWLLPFEAIGRIVGISPFPDRIALLVALTLFIYYGLSMNPVLRQAGFSAPVALGASILICTAPPVLTLMISGPQNVYEDASLYALLTSLSILVALVRYAAIGKRSDFWIGCALCAMSGLVRPTHAMYGMIGVLLLIVWSFGRLRLVERIAGGLLVSFGMLALAVTKFIRFGSMFEFGHKLTATPLNGIMTSRFVNPIAQATHWQAARELFGAMFLWLGSHEGKNAFSRGLFPGQTTYFRWRDFYLSTFDPSVLGVVLLGGILGMNCFRPAGEELTSHTRFRSRLGRSLFGFGVIPLLGIFAFMMHYAGLCARYLYDFTPAFTALTLIAWLMLVRRYGVMLLLILISWIGFEVYRMDCTEPPMPLATALEAKVKSNRNSLAGMKTFESAGFYTAEAAPTGPLYRQIQMGWDLDTKQGSYVMMLPIDEPQFVEIEVEDRLRTGLASGRVDSYRARIGVSELEKISEERDGTNGRIKVRFKVPDRMIDRAGDELLSLCFVSVGDDEDQDSRRIVESIRWRNLPLR